jgi:hypothetical protein
MTKMVRHSRRRGNPVLVEKRAPWRPFFVVRVGPHALLHRVNSLMIPLQILDGAELQD